MSSKSSPLKGIVSAEIYEAAKAISEIKGENIDTLLSKFLTEYVHDNLHILTEKAISTMPLKEG